MSFLVRLPDMHSRTPETEAERNEAVRKFSRIWIDLQIEGHRGQEKENEPWAKAVVGRIKEPTRYNFVGWKYEKTESRYGLTEETLVGGDTEKRKKEWLTDKNLMYDEGSWTAYIQCDTHQSSNPNHRQRCRHAFSLRPRINAHVTVNYDAEHLKDWKSIQQKLTVLLYGFIVGNNDQSAYSPDSSAQQCAFLRQAN